MFNLESFIRQLLPPIRRTPVAVGVARVLFQPGQTVMDRLVAARRDLLTSAGSTGQVIVLEELLNQALYPDSPGMIYLLDSTTTGTDFQVIVPSSLTPSQISLVSAIVQTHKQAGKRFIVATQPTYTVPSNGMAWVNGYPQIQANNVGTSITFAINKTGRYQVVISAAGNEVRNLMVDFVAGVPVNYGISLVRPTWTIRVGGLVAVLSGSNQVATVVVNRIGSESQLSVLAAQTGTGALTATLTGTGYSQTKTFITTGGPFATPAGTNPTTLPLGVLFLNVPNGTYTLTLTDANGSTSSWPLTLTDTGPIQSLTANTSTSQITALAYQRSGTNLTVLANTTLGGTAEVRLTGNGLNDTFGQTQLATTVLAGVNYSRSRAYTNIPDGTYTIEGRIVGTQTVVSLQITLGTTTPASIDLATVPTLQNRFIIDLRPRNYDIINLALDRYDAATGRVYVKDLATKSPADFGQSGKTWMYHVNGRYYTAQQFLSAGWPRNFPHFVMKFLVDTSQPRYTWRRDTTINDNTKFRYI